MFNKKEPEKSPYPSFTTDPRDHMKELPPEPSFNPEKESVSQMVDPQKGEEPPQTVTFQQLMDAVVDLSVRISQLESSLYRVKGAL